MEYTGLALLFDSGGSKLLIKPHKYQYPESTCADDRSCIYTTVRIEVKGFVGRYAVTIRDVEFALLCKELKCCYADLKYEFEFSIMEGGLGLNVKGDGLGHFLVNVVCQQDDLRLSFEIIFDQSFLPKMIEDLEEINKRYPYNRKMFSI